jgi:hypothetical protein
MDKVSDGLLQRLRYIADTDDARFSGIDQTLNEAADELAAQKEQFRVLEDEMLVMMDERNAAVKDAERYRWLRERHWEDANMFVVSGGHSRVKLATNCPSGEFLDAAIDAAMKEMK